MKPHVILQTYMSCEVGYFCPLGCNQTNDMILIFYVLLCEAMYHSEV